MESDRKDDDQLPDKEIAERMDKALRRSFNMPHKPHKPARKPARKSKSTKKEA